MRWTIVIIIDAARNELDNCDLCLVVGTSSVVYPAAMFAPQVKLLEPGVYINLCMHIFRPMKHLVGSARCNDVSWKLTREKICKE